MNILHLSDIHFGRNNPKYNIKNENFEKKDTILSKLITTLGSIQQSQPIDHIFFTGDIAWWGKKEDFDEAVEWFLKLLDAVHLTGKDITFCPGNHDANRVYENSPIKYKENMVKEIDEIYSYEKYHVLEAPFYWYNKFCEKLGVIPYSYPYIEESTGEPKIERSYCVGYKDIVLRTSESVRIVSFNTSLMSSMPQYADDKMWIGQSQLKSLIEYGILPVKLENSISIALFHHAERFLSPHEVCEYNGRPATLPLLRRYVNLVLCGHTETGGRPVLQKQADGGAMLTAGAAYFNDEHPNTFSLIELKKDNKGIQLTLRPYIYKDEWVEYNYDGGTQRIKKIKTLPEIANIDGKCVFELWAGEDNHKLTMKQVKSYEYEKNGLQYVRLDNESDVTRKLDIICNVAVKTGNSSVDVKLAPKMERDVSAMLEREKYFAFLRKIKEDNLPTNFNLRTSWGKDIVSACSLNIGECDFEDSSIEILEKLCQVEEYFDIKLWRPDSLYELDLKKVNLLVELIEKGYTCAFKLGNTLSSNISDKEKLRSMKRRAKSNNSFVLSYQKEFVCTLHGVTFDLGRVMIIAGPYHINIGDINYKVKTFCKNDKREVRFDANTDMLTYFVTDIDRAKDHIAFKKDIEPFGVNNMELDFGFILEKELYKKIENDKYN